VRQSTPRIPDSSAPWRPASMLAILALLLLLPGLIPPGPSARAATADALFHSTRATASFPEWIAFELDVESETALQSVELFWTPAGSPTLSVAAPAMTPGERIQLVHELDMTINYLPPGVDLIYFWRVTNQAGHVTESPRETLFYMDERHDWRSRTQGNVTLFWYNGGDNFSEDILNTAGRTTQRMAERFGVESSEPIRIIIYGNERDFNRSLPPNSAEWIGGQAYPGLNLIFAVIQPGGGSPTEVRRMIPHEVSHLLLNQATRNPYNSPPNWLDEGLAVYNQETIENRFQQILDRAVRDGQLIPVRALNSSFPFDPDQALLSYAQSWSIVRYIVEVHGDNAMAELISIFREDSTYDGAVQHALGMNIDELDGAWKGWLGYQGDRAPPVRNATEDDEETSFTRTEKLVILPLSAVAAFAGLGLSIYSIRRLRQMRSPR
jgi:hypothetical protein